MSRFQPIETDTGDGHTAGDALPPRGGGRNQNRVNA